MMKRSQKENEQLLETVAAMYPDAQVALHFETTFQLLIAVILSAQTTDVAVNKATPALFAAYPNAGTLAQAPLEDVMAKIKTIGLYRNKAKNIIACSQMLVERFGGRVPQSQKDLMQLPGVGQKTANVVRSVAFHIPAFAVDTHIQRIAKRLQIVPENAKVEEVEKTITSIMPPSRWNALHHQLIYFGRYFCTAKKPHCAECPVLAACKFGPNYLAEQQKKG